MQLLFYVLIILTIKVSKNIPLFVFINTLNGTGGSQSTISGLKNNTKRDLNC